MTSRESLSTLLTLFKGTRGIVSSHLHARQTQLCDFYRGSILTKSLRVNDEMWEELTQLSQEIKQKEQKSTAAAAAAGSKKDVKEIGKRMYSTRARRTTNGEDVS